jgi:RNA polymerase sigma factor (sigma-70 family)
MSEQPSTHATRPSLLVRLADSGDAEAWQGFVHTYTPLVYGYCRRHGLQDADAADVAQLVLTDVLRAMRGHFEYQRERGRFRDWLGTVTHHQLLRFLHKRGRTMQTEGGAATVDLDQLAAAGPDAGWEAEFNARVLRAAMERIRPVFEPSTWRAFERVWLEDCPALEAASEVDLTIEAVYAAKSRVLKRLREEIVLLAEDLPQCMPLD